MSRRQAPRLDKTIGGLSSTFVTVPAGISDGEVPVYDEGTGLFIPGAPGGGAPAAHAASHAAGGGDRLWPIDLGFDARMSDFTAGEHNGVEISSNGCATTSGTVRLLFFTAQRTESIGSVMISAGSTAAGATVSLCKYGIYTVDGSGNLTLAHSTASDTSLMGSTNTEYAKALTSTWSKVRGTRYAVGFLIVTSGTAPTLNGQSVAALSAINGSKSYRQRRTGALTSQTDLPASISAGSLTGSSSAFYAEFVPAA